MIAFSKFRFFFRNKEALELKIMIFENSSPKGILRQIMKCQNSRCPEIVNAIRQGLLRQRFYRKVLPFDKYLCLVLGNLAKLAKLPLTTNKTAEAKGKCQELRYN